MKTQSCAFSGHRPHKFPWKDNEDDPRCIALKKILTEQITALVNAGVTDFFSGMAEGTDCYCSQIVLTLRVKNPALKLHCVLPHEGQSDKWSNSARKRYNAILKQADSVEYVMCLQSAAIQSAAHSACIGMMIRLSIRKEYQLGRMKFLSTKKSIRTCRLVGPGADSVRSRLYLPSIRIRQTGRRFVWPHRLPDHRRALISSAP